MRSLLGLLLFAWCAPAGAVELRSEIVAGPGFLYGTSEVEHALLEDRLTLGAGYVVVSDLKTARHGGQLTAELEIGPFTIGVLGGGAPPQQHRGWLLGELTVGGKLERRRVTAEAELAVLGRRADIGLGKSVRTVDQLQLRLSATLTIDERWDVGLRGILSFYDVNLAQRSWRGAETGLLVSAAGHPERWLVGVDGGWRPHRRWRAAISLSGMLFADGRGAAVLPGVRLASGPWGWLTVETWGELVIPTTSLEPVRFLVGASFAVTPTKKEKPAEE